MIKKVLLIMVLAMSALSAGINTDRVVVVCDDDGCKTVIIFDGK